MIRSYRVHEFADLAGVTVKALHHYDRLGLLKPGRSSAGYRLYCDRDLERLEQILALKFLGIPLKQIREVLDREELPLQEMLRRQRLALEQKRTVMDRAIQAIRTAEDALAPEQPALLKKIIEVIAMQQDVEAMKKYYSDASWERHRRYYEEGPSAEWQTLYREVEGLLGEDPGGERAQTAADRWLELALRAYQGDPEVQTDSPMAWMDRDHWPPTMKQRLANYNLEGVTEYMRQAVLSTRKKYFGPAAWARFEERRKLATDDNPASHWQERVDLFRDIEALLSGDPAGAAAQALAARWEDQQERTSGSDPEIRKGLQSAWTDRRNWSPTLRYVMEGLHMMPYDRFLKCADFIDQAIASRDLD